VGVQKRHSLGDQKTLKILHLGKYFPPVVGGIENFLYDLVKAQKSSGVEPLVLVHNEKPFHSTLRQLTEGVEITRSASFGSVLYTPVSPSFPFSLGAYLQKKPDIVHVHMPNPSAFWLLLHQVEAPIVIHWHSDVVAHRTEGALKLAYRLYRIFEKMLLERAQAVIVTSENYLSSSKVLEDYRGKCHVISLGIDPRRMEPVRPASSDSDELLARTGGRFTVLSAGRFTPYKGFEYLIKAMQEVEDSLLIVAGNGKLFKNMLRLVHDLGLQEKVELVGHVSTRRLHELMSSCHAFCLPSIERTEAFGLVLVEAMFYAKPLITTDIPGSGVSWVNQKGITGLHVPLADAHAMAQAINYLRDQTGLRKKMGENARSRFEEKFDIKFVNQQILSLYESLILQ